MAMKPAVIGLTIAASMSLTFNFAFAGGEWPGSHPPKYNKLAPSSSSTTGNQIRRDLVRNPGLFKQMLKRREVREQLKGDREMMKEMLKNEELRGEVLRYPDLEDRVKRDPIMREMAVEVKPADQTEQKGESNETRPFR